MQRSSHGKDTSEHNEEILLAAAYGGAGWQPRQATHREEIGKLWHACGIKNEWGTLRQVILHRPGQELLGIEDPDFVQMLEVPDAKLAQAQHDQLAQTYESEGVKVHLIAPSQVPPPNLMFVADLIFMTPEGAIVCRPASTVRAGEERLLVERLAALGIPIFRMLRGDALFEGADAAWLDSSHVLIGTGVRTNLEGARQLASALSELGVSTSCVDLPRGAMHLMGMLRFPDSGLAVARAQFASPQLIEILEKQGFRVLPVPDSHETIKGLALNLVTLAPGKVLMPGGNPLTQTCLEAAGIACRTVVIDELVKAAGGVACLTGVIERS